MTGLLRDVSVGVGPRTPAAATTANTSSAEASLNTPLYEARMENVRLVTELRNLLDEREQKRHRSMEIAAWRKRHTAARNRADAYRLRVRELEDAIASWLVGDLDEDGLAAFLTSNGTARKPVRASASGARRSL